MDSGLVAELVIGRPLRAGLVGANPEWPGAHCSSTGWAPARGEARLRAHRRCGKDRPAFNSVWRSTCAAGAADGDGLKACCRSSVVEHSLGKGEVDSSILSGSTSKISNKQTI
jgi:hypothetical protein